MITHADLGIADEDLAREVLVLARDIAPGLDALADEDRENAIAILRRVAKDAPPSGGRRVRSKSRNGTSISYDTVGEAFHSQARRALRALCGISEDQGMPRGSFPTDRPLARIFPEGGYS